ncbi:MAG: peptidylprolyl isomerase [Acidimicrobiia bacterium]
MSLRRPLRAMLVPVVVALVAAACGETVERPAVAINGEAISRADLLSELADIAVNSDFLATIDPRLAASKLRTGGDANGGYDPAFVAQLLGRRIVLSLVRAEVVARGLVADAACREAAVFNTRAQLGSGDAAAGTALLDKFPPAYRDRLVGWTLDQQLLVAALSAQACIVADPGAAYYAAHPEAFEEACLSVIVVADGEAAERVVTQLGRGSGFASLARRSSIDAQSAPDGGDIGCKTRAELPAELAPAAFALEPGTTSDPIAAPAGVTVLRVSERRLRPLEETRAQADQLAASSSSGAFNEWLGRALATMEIDLDPRYGAWNAQSNRIDPPPDASPTTAPPALPPSLPSSPAPDGSSPPAPEGAPAPASDPAAAAHLAGPRLPVA